ncbi:MAG TPA: hypothetical protein VFE24_07535 [Pirellulales bacterium]|nr:hypothetical protein [Pirellulales bacterium]
MPHPLLNQIEAVRSRARAQLLLFAFARLVLIVGLAWLALGALDYWLRFRDEGVRLICSAAAGGVLVWSGYRFLLPALRYRPGDIEIAQSIERQMPRVQRQLASTIDFLHQAEDDPTAGSLLLRRAVIARTTAELDNENLAQIVDARPARRAWAWAAIPVLAALALAVWAPSSLALGLTRLAAPFGSAVWPQQHHLHFTPEVRRLAQGQPFEVELFDANQRLPAEVRIHYRTLSGGQPGEEQVEKMQFVNDRMVARRDAVQRPFEYRAEGGDDQSMPWIRVAVLEPPRLEALKIKLTPPAYTGRPAEPSERRIVALQETEVAMTGTVSMALRSATVHFTGGATLPVAVDPAGRTFHLPIDDLPEHQWRIEKSGEYWFEFVDTDDLTAGPENKYELRAIPDLPPTVILEQPAANLFVTAEADVPLRVLAKDDLAIRSIGLKFSRSDHSEQKDFDLPLFAGPEALPRPADGAPASAEPGEARTIEQVWKLGPLKLPPGTQVLFHAVAADYKGQSGHSTPRQLTVITTKELEDRFAQRQANILGELARALKMERDAKAQTDATAIQQQQVGHLQKPDIDRLQSIELNQRQIARTLTSPTDGLVNLIESLLTDLQSNHVSSPDLERRMRGLQAELAGLEREHLPQIERALTAAAKSGQNALDAPEQKSDGALAAALQSAATHESAVISALERWLGDLKQWDNYRRFARDIGDVRQSQAAIAAETAKLQPTTLSQEVKDLTPQQQADLKKLSLRQADLGRQFDKLLQQMDAMSESLKENEPVASETIGDAVAAAREAAISTQMQSSGRQIDRNQLTSAQQQQTKTGQDLQELLDILSDRREQELSRMVKKLKAAEQELTALRKEQAGLRKQSAAAEKLADAAARKQALQRLAREEKELAEKIERFARRLQRLQAEQAARAAAQGGSAVAKAGETGEKGDAAAAAGAAAAAEKDLDEAQQQLANARRKAEADLAQEELAKLQTALQSLHDREQKIIAETIRLADLKQAQSRLTRAQAESLQDLARTQDALREETLATGEKLAGAEVFNLALKMAAAEMARAVDALDQRDPGATAQQAEQRALAQLAEILTALAEDKESGPPKTADDPGNGGDNQGQQAESIRNLSELKLLKLMQLDVNRRTKELTDKSAGHAALTDAERREYGELGRQQGRLAEMLERMLKPADADPEQTPEKLPDVRPKPSAGPADDGLLPP